MNRIPRRISESLFYLQARRRILLLVALGLFVLAIPELSVANQEPPPVFVHADTLTDREVGWAIEAIKKALLDLQGPQGTWERQYPQKALAHLNRHAGGQSTLAFLALLSAGESYQAPQLQAALDFIASSKSDYTYVRSLRAHVWALLPQRFAKALEAERNWLLSTYGYNTGSWGYTAIPANSGYDNSLTQYGVLGLWEAAKRGLPVPTRFWQRAEDHFLRTQLVDGGWNYRPQWSQARGSMTAAGLTCLFITQDYLHAADYLKVARSERAEEVAIRKGLQWLDKNFTAERHPGGPGNSQEHYFYYYLYGIERVGLASGYRRFAGEDWFRAGAAAIITRMCDPRRDSDGEIIGYQIKTAFAGTGNTEVRVVQLSFALMFLAHGRLPIAVSKLQDRELAWNNRPRDAANLARRLSTEVEEQRNWQILEIESPLAEWFESPLVYLATHEPLPYVRDHQQALQQREPETEAQRFSAATRLERLRRYLSLGGLLVTTADDSRAGVTQSVRDLARQMFPAFSWRRLPEDHWAYTLSAPVLKRPVLYGLTNGVRELMIHFAETDVGAVLQANEPTRDADTFATLSNIYFYASERGLTRARLERKIPPGVAARRWSGPIGVDASTTLRRGTVWRGVYEGNWNPEPAADELLQLKLAAERGIAVEFVDLPLSTLNAELAVSGNGNGNGNGNGDGDGGGGGFLFLRGTSAVTFTPLELAGIRRFAEAGGVLLIENVGGVGDFGKSTEAALRNLFAGERFRRVTAKHPLITGVGLPRGVDCSRVAYRLYSLEHFGAREYRPRLRTLNPKNEPGGLQIFVSRADLSYAMLDQPCWGVSGYSTADAGRLLGNLLEFALQTGKDETDGAAE